MKKYITAAALLAAGTMLTNAASVVLSTNVSETATASSSNYDGIVFSVSSDWLNGALSPETYTGFTLDSLSIEMSSLTSGYKIALRERGTNTYVGVSNSGTTSSDGFVTFSFNDGVSLDLNTIYDAEFVTSTTRLNGKGISNGQFGIRQSLKAYSNADVGTTNTSTGFLSGFHTAENKTATTTLADSGYKANIKLTGTAIPEPSAFGLLAGVGALALVASRRRRKA